MIPVRLWASVSWISPAIRCRSWRTPASRAWVSSCSCRPAFSASVASSRWLASRTSARACSRCAAWVSLLQSIQARAHRGITLTERTAAYTMMPNGLARSTPEVWEVAATTATAATPGSRHGHGRTANAYRYPAGVRNPNQGSLITSAAMIAMNTMKNTAITRGRTRHPGCRVNIHSIHAAARPHRARSMARDPIG